MIKDITPKDVKARLDAGEPIEIIDVREDWEVARGMIAEARHIPMNDVPDFVEEIPQDKPVVIVCHSGARSEQVAVWLEAEGFENVLNMVGGMSRWSRDVDPSMPG